MMAYIVVVLNLVIVISCHVHGCLPWLDGTHQVGWCIGKVGIIFI